VAKIIKEDVSGYSLNLLLDTLKLEIGGEGTIIGFIEFIRRIFSFVKECEDKSPEHMIPEAYLT
jgi:hypothetical protein